MIQYGWLVALLLVVAVSSWLVLLLQALFHDRKIALVGVFASLLVAFVAVFPELGGMAKVIKAAAAGLCVAFLLWFLIKQYHRPYVYLPVMMLLLCAATAGFLWQKIII